MQMYELSLRSTDIKEPKQEIDFSDVKTSVLLM